MTSKNFASQNFSLPEWATGLRQPIVLATLASIGFHGLVFAAVPLLSQESDVPEEPESVGVVELTAEELARLPDFAQRDALNLGNFDSSLVAPDGLPLPVPGEIPPSEEDFTDFDGGILGMLPPVDLEGDVDGGFDGGFDFDGDFSGGSFEDNGGFDDGFDDGFDFDSAFVGGTTFDGGTSSNGAGFDDSGFDGNFDLSDPTPEPQDFPADSSALNDIESSFDSEIDENLVDPMQPPIQVDENGNIIPPEDPGSMQVAAKTDESQAEETEPDVASGVETSAESENDLEENATQTPEPSSDPVPPEPPTLRPAEDDLRAEIARRRAIARKYAPNGTEAVGEGVIAQRLGDFMAAANTPPKPKRFVTLPLPEDFPNCASDVRAAAFLVTRTADENAEPTVEMLQGTGYSALDDLVNQAMEAEVAQLPVDIDPISNGPVPALYPFEVTFEDQPDGCNAEALS